MICYSTIVEMSNDISYQTVSQVVSFLQPVWMFQTAVRMVWTKLTHLLKHTHTAIGVGLLAVLPTTSLSPRNVQKMLKISSILSENVSEV
jgi:hypothetical protein